MVKVNGPMFSLAASGTLGKAIVFSSWKGRPYVRERVIPSNPKTGAQVGRRAMFTHLAEQWKDLAADTRALWQDIADDLVVSTFNAFVSFNMRHWHNFLAPCTHSAPARTGTAADDTLSAAAWEENRIKLTSDITTTNQGRGSILFASQTESFTPSVGTAIAGYIRSVVAEYITYWTPPAIGTWYFNIRPYTGEGLLSAATGEMNT